jgi:hypothetical protein
MHEWARGQATSLAVNLFEGNGMARNPVTPVASVDRVSNARIGQRGATYFTQLEEWRIYSQLLAAERRQKEQAVMDHDFEQTLNEYKRHPE